MIDLKGIKLLRHERLLIKFIAPIYELKRKEDQELYWIWSGSYIWVVTSEGSQIWFEKSEVLKLAQEQGLYYLGELSHLDEVINNNKYKESDLCVIIPCGENAES